MLAAGRFVVAVTTSCEPSGTVREPVSENGSGVS